MTLKRSGMARKAGLPPGALLHVGRRYAEDMRMTILDYDGETARERDAGGAEGLQARPDKAAVTWISVTGLHDVGVVEKVGAVFGIHPLVLEDILTTNQRPKLEDYSDYLYVVLRSVAMDSAGQLAGEQVSLIVGDGYVVSFQESDRDLFRHVRERINSGKGRIRREGADYLAYSLIDAIVDNYFVILEATGERLEDLEEGLVDRPDHKILAEIHAVKQEMLHFRKALWPLREVIGTLSRGETPLIKATTLPYIRDVYDHTIEVIDTLETYRDIVSGFLDIYLSGVSNRLNRIMKVLTLISTVFMPLTFISGVYGMNFKYIPGLEQEWGFFAVVAVMLFVGLAMVQYFRTRDWL